MKADRRTLRAAEGVAHESLRGTLDGLRFTEGRWRRVAAPLAELCATPAGARDRQLLLGARFCALLSREGWSFGFDEDEGYCGWIAEGDLGPDVPVSHWLSAPASHLYPAPDLKTREIAALSMGARVAVEAVENGFARTSHGHIPAQHLRALGDWRDDPVAAARDFLGTPYLWGGNTRAGLDCSGLVQAAFRACGRFWCPADSDQQGTMAGADVLPGDEMPGDLIFWTGHVGMVSAPGRLIHANAHHMAVAEEPLAAAEARIAGKGERLTRRLRPTGA